MHGGGVDVLPAFGGVVGDALRAAVRAQERLVLLAAPVPIQPVLAEGLVERLALDSEVSAMVLIDPNRTADMTVLLR